MIKAVTTRNTKLELMHEFLGILESLEGECPDVVLKALDLHMEDKRNDN